MWKVLALAVLLAGCSADEPSADTSFEPPLLARRVDVSSNGYVCAVLGDGRVSCWGGGNLPTLVERVHDAVAVAGDCALTKTNVMCWDNNGPRRIAVDMPDSEGALDLAWRRDGACILTPARTVACTRWTGYAPVPVGGMHDIVAFTHSEDGDAVCVVTSSGRVECNTWEIDGVSPPARSVIVRSGTCERRNHGVFCFDGETWREKLLPARAVDLSCDSGTCCAALAQGDVSCWGNNSNGQLGDGDPHSVPHQVLGLPAIAWISVGIGSSLAVTFDGALYAWGRGFGSRPVRVADRVIAATIGYESVWYSTGDDLVRAATERDRVVFRSREMPPPKRVTSMTHGNGVRDPLCATLVDHRTMCLLRSSSDDRQNTWREIPELRGLRSFVSDRPCGVNRHGKTVCVETTDGRRSYKMVPLSLNVDPDDPKLVGFTDLGDTNSVMGSSICGLHEGIPTCWNPYKQNDPEPVARGLHATRLASTWSHVCALTGEHTVWCWGDDQNGEAGSGRMLSRDEPMQVEGLGP